MTTEHTREELRKMAKGLLKSETGIGLSPGVVITEVAQALLDSYRREEEWAVKYRQAIAYISFSEGTELVVADMERTMALLQGKESDA